jgi:hypothetical protein
MYNMYIWTNRVVLIQKLNVKSSLTSPNLRFCSTNEPTEGLYYYYIHCLLWMAATAAAAVVSAAVVLLLALLLEAGAEYVDYPEFT